MATAEKPVAEEKQPAGKEKTAKKIPAIASNPKGRFGAHRIVDGRTLCGIDARNWMSYDASDEVTCPYCLIREKHGITVPTSFEALPEAAQKEITSKMKAVQKAADKEAAAQRAADSKKVEEVAADEVAAPDKS